jgi:hypothetical protein
MKLKFNAPLSTAIAIGVGIIVLLGYFFGTNAFGEATTVGILRDYFLQGAVVWAAVALLVGIFNLAAVHLRKIRGGKEGGYSVILLISLIGTLGIGLYDIAKTQLSQEPNFQRVRWVFNHVQLPIETSLMAVLAVSLTFAVARLLARRLNILAIIFVSVVLLLLIGAIPQITSLTPIFTDLRTWIITVPAVGGARGILLGVALGTIAAGIRILTGRERPYRG